MIVRIIIKNTIKTVQDPDLNLNPMKKMRKLKKSNKRNNNNN